jgi:hypothetical protein
LKTKQKQARKFNGSDKARERVSRFDFNRRDRYMKAPVPGDMDGQEYKKK